MAKEEEEFNPKFPLKIIPTFGKFLDDFIAQEDDSIDWLMKANQLVSPDEDGGGSVGDVY